MTAGDMIEEVFNELGEHTDCDPYTLGALDPASAGYQRILLWINKAYHYVANFKFTSGRQTHFRELERRERMKSQLTSATIYSIADPSRPVIGPNASYIQYLFEGWVLVGPNGSTHEVMVSTVPGAGLLQLDLCNPITAIVGDTVQLYRRCYPYRTDLGLFDWTFSALPIEISRIFDLSQDIELSRVPRDETLFSGRRSIGDPTSFAIRGQCVEFDVAPSTSRWLTVEHFALPDPLVLPGDEPVLPEPFHYPIKLMALVYGFRQKEELTDAWKMEQSFNKAMAEARTPSDHEDEVAQKTYRVDTGRT